MKNQFMRISLVVMLIGLFCFPVVSGARVLPKAGPQDFILVNKTGVEIYALYISPDDSNNWEEDILGADTLPNGQSLKINFSRTEDAEYWDLRVEDHEGTYIEWEELNLLEISKVTLYYKNGKATAVVE